jgi:hypothetical protein
MAPMHRTQISLGEEHYRFLVDEGRRLGISLAEVVRRLISERMTGRRESGDPFEALAGAGEGDGRFSGRDHDRVLYGDPGG